MQQVAKELELTERELNTALPRDTDVAALEDQLLRPDPADYETEEDWIMAHPEPERTRLAMEKVWGV